MKTEFLGLNFKNWIKLRRWRPYFIFFVIAFLLYGQTLLFDFTYFDDHVLILNNAALLSDIKNIGAIFANDVFFSDNSFYYRPLLNISLMLDTQIGGVSPFIYHLGNIILHLVASSLIFYLLILITKRKPLAFWLSTLFLVHPSLTQAVAWIPGRNDSLLTIFTLLAFVSFLSYLKKSKLLSYFSYLLFFLLALLTKEVAISLPLLVILYYLLIANRKIITKEFFYLLLGSTAVILTWSSLRYLALTSAPITNSMSVINLFEKLPGIFVYIGKLIFPVNLSLFPTISGSAIVYGLLAIVVLIISLILSKEKRGKYIVFGSLWFLAFLLPPLLLKSSSEHLINFLEHRLYLPFFGFLIIISEIDFIKNLRFAKRGARFTTFGILIILVGISFYHGQSFKDALTFRQEAAKGTPESPKIQNHLGLTYYEVNNYEMAEKHYQLALELSEVEPKLNYNLGILYMNQGKYDLAKVAFEKELEVSKDNEEIIEMVRNSLKTLNQKK